MKKIYHRIQHSTLYLFHVVFFFSMYKNPKYSQKFFPPDSEKKILGCKTKVQLFFFLLFIGTCPSHHNFIYADNWWKSAENQVLRRIPKTKVKVRPTSDDVFVKENTLPSNLIIIRIFSIKLSTNFVIVFVYSSCIFSEIILSLKFVIFVEKCCTGGNTHLAPNFKKQIWLVNFISQFFRGIGERLPSGKTTNLKR